MTLEEACNAVRLYVEAKESSASNSMGEWSWIDRLDDCLADIRAELSEAAQDDGKWSRYLDMISPAPQTNLQAENDRLRKVVSDCAAALGNGAAVSTSCSLEFMEELPKEVALVVAGLRAAAPAPQQHKKSAPFTEIEWLTRRLLDAIDEAEDVPDEVLEAFKALDNAISAVPTPPQEHVDTSILRERISRAIFDPGQTEGVKGHDKTLTDWQTDAVMRVLGHATTEGQP